MYTINNYTNNDDIAVPEECCLPRFITNVDYIRPLWA